MPDAHPSPRWTSYAKATVAIVVWGLSFVAARIALEAVTPLGLVWIRNGLATVLLFALLRARGLRWLPDPSVRGRCVLLGAILAAHMLMQAAAMRWTTAARAGWIVAVMPVAIAIGARLFLGQRMRALGWLGIAIATSGVFVLTSTKPAQFADAGRGDALMIATTVTWASYVLLSLSASRSSGGLSVAASALAVSVVPTALAAGFSGTWHADPGWRELVALAFLGFGASAIGMWTFTAANAELGPERVSAFQYLQPFVTVVGSQVLLAEPMTRAQIVGGPIVLAGVWLVQRAKRAASPAPPRGAPGRA